MGRLPSFQHSVRHHSSLLSLLLLPSTSAYVLSEVNWIMNRSFLWLDPCAHNQLAHVAIEDSPVSVEYWNLSISASVTSANAISIAKFSKKKWKRLWQPFIFVTHPQPSLLQSVWKMAHDKEKKEVMPCNFYSKNLATLALCMHTVTSVNKLFWKCLYSDHFSSETVITTLREDSPVSIFSLIDFQTTVTLRFYLILFVVVV